jgi:cyclophilin family peptidyl-prolyl cis-trans isomerase/protein-disulfide isomerase
LEDRGVKVRRFGLILFLLSVVLAACQSSNTDRQEMPTGTPMADCEPVSFNPTPEPTLAALLPPAEPGDWVKGSENPLLTIIEYSDFQCPACAAAAPVLAQLQAENPEDVRIIYRHFPLMSIHGNAALAAQASEAAGKQEKFWEMHDLLFEEQGNWSSLSVDEFEDWLIQKAEDLDLDVERFQSDLASPELVALAEQAWNRGQEIGLPGTPFLVVNNRPYQGPADLATLSSFLDAARLSQKAFNSCPPIVIDPERQYLATLETEKGDIVIELFADQAPLAVNNFIFLAQQDWFDGVTFHRVIPNFVAQSGDPSGSGMGGPGYAFKNEIVSDLKFDQPGVVGMANSGEDTNGSQFFITFAPVEQLNGGYTIFGRVIEGLDVAEKLTPRDPSTGTSLPPGDKILNVIIEEK